MRYEQKAQAISWTLGNIMWDLLLCLEIFTSNHLLSFTILISIEITFHFYGNACSIHTNICTNTWDLKSSNFQWELEFKTHKAILYVYLTTKEIELTLWRSWVLLYSNQQENDIQLFSFFQELKVILKEILLWPKAKIVTRDH